MLSHAITRGLYKLGMITSLITLSISETHAVDWMMKSATVLQVQHRDGPCVIASPAAEKPCRGEACMMRQDCHQKSAYAAAGAHLGVPIGKEARRHVGLGVVVWQEVLGVHLLVHVQHRDCLRSVQHDTGIKRRSVSDLGKGGVLGCVLRSSVMSRLLPAWCCVKYDLESDTGSTCVAACDGLYLCSKVTLSHQLGQPLGRCVCVAVARK